MKFEVRLKSSGQIAIPLEIREELGLKPGDTISFGRNRDGEIVLLASKRESPFAKYRGIGNPGIGSGLNAINRHIREMRGFDPDKS